MPHAAPMLDSKRTPQLSVVVPCCDEAAVLAETARRLGDVLDRLVEADRIADCSRVFFVDDGSQDESWAIIERLARQTPQFQGIKLSRNHGHQNALMAGMLTAPGDVVVSIDADLQDDPEAIDAMIAAHAEGADIVYAVRNARRSDTLFKRRSAHAYHRVLRWMGVQVIGDHADFRLLSRRVVEALRAHGESNLFLRALIPQLGFTTATVTYERAKRFAGTSKYPLGRMVSLGLEGITSFSIRPLRAIFVLGFVVSILSACLGIWALVMALVFHSVVPGWTSTVVPIYLVCGLQMLCLGVIGEYIGKIYLETKHRPRFIIEHTTWSDNDDISDRLLDRPDDATRHATKKRRRVSQPADDARSGPPART